MEDPDTGAANPSRCTTALTAMSIWEVINSRLMETIYHDDDDEVSLRVLCQDTEEEIFRQHPNLNLVLDDQELWERFLESHDDGGRDQRCRTCRRQSVGLPADMPLPPSTQ